MIDLAPSSSHTELALLVEDVAEESAGELGMHPRLMTGTHLLEGDHTCAVAVGVECGHVCSVAQVGGGEEDSLVIWEGVETLYHIGEEGWASLGPTACYSRSPHGTGLPARRILSRSAGPLSTGAWSARHSAANIHWTCNCEPRASSWRSDTLLRYRK